MAMVPREILETIMESDPDGWMATQPQPADYARFKAWVLRIYGQEAWTAYHIPWDDPCDRY